VPLHSDHFNIAVSQSAETNDRLSKDRYLRTYDTEAARTRMQQSRRM